jgi:hypothetical protein
VVVATWHGEWLALLSFSARPGSARHVTPGSAGVFATNTIGCNLRADLRQAFHDRGTPEFSEPPTLSHGGIEWRSIWITTRLNHHLDFPGVGQVFVIERHTLEKKTGKTSIETLYGITSHTPQSADAARAKPQSRPRRDRERLPFPPRLELG